MSNIRGLWTYATQCILSANLLTVTFQITTTPADVAKGIKKAALDTFSNNTTMQLTILR